MHRQPTTNGFERAEQIKCWLLGATIKNIRLYRSPSSTIPGQHEHHDREQLVLSLFPVVEARHMQQWNADRDSIAKLRLGGKRKGTTAEAVL
jgi:hypothetical protein